MTFDASIPLSTDSPALFPSQSQQNFQVLQTIVGKDHQFNLTPAGGDNSGYHTIVHMIPQSTPGAVAGHGQLYGKLSSGVAQLYYEDSAGTEYRLAPKTATNIVAAVNFNGISGASIRGTAFNVSGVTRTGTGSYTITFASPLSNNNYVVQITGMRNGTDDISNGQVAGNATYGNSVSTNFLKVQFNGGSSGLNDVLMGNVVIYQP